MSRRASRKTDEDDLDHELQGAERREFLRVRARLRMRERVVGPGEIEVLRHEIETRVRLDDTEIDPRLLAHFERIELKLDRILSHLDPNIAQPLATVEPRWVEISGSGIRLATKQPPPPRSHVLVEFLLPDSSVPVRLIGSVRSHIERRLPGEDGEIVVAFEVIHESDRAAIVRFVLEMERCGVRERSRVEEEAS